MSTYDMDKNMSEDSLNKNIEARNNESIAEILSSSKIVDVTSSGASESLTFKETARKNDFQVAKYNEDIVNMQVDEKLHLNVTFESAAETNNTSSYRTNENSSHENISNEGITELFSEIVPSEIIDIISHKVDNTLQITDKNLSENIRNENIVESDDTSSHRSSYKNICNEGTTANIQQKNRRRFSKISKNSRTSSESSEDYSIKPSTDILMHTKVAKGLCPSDPLKGISKFINYGISTSLRLYDFVEINKEFEKKLDILLIHCQIKSDLPEDIEKILTLILIASDNKDIALYLAKSSLLQELMKNSVSRPELMKSILQIIIKVCQDHKAIDLISNDRKLIEIIVGKLEKSNILIQLKILKFLQLIIKNKIEIINYKIENSFSYWFEKMKKCFKLLERYIRIAVNDICDEKLYFAIIEVLQLISYGFDGNLSQLFSRKMNNFICAFISSGIKMQKKTKNNSDKKLTFYKKWLIIITDLQKHFTTVFPNENDEDFITLLMIIRNILKLYKCSNVLSSELEVTKNYDMIIHILNLLSCIRKSFYLPLAYDRVLANLTYKVSETVKDLNLDETETNSGQLMICKLLNILKQNWLLLIVQNRNSLEIAEIIYLCPSNVSRYLIDLGINTSADMTRKKLSNANTAYKTLILSDWYD